MTLSTHQFFNGYFLYRANVLDYERFRCLA